MKGPSNKEWCDAVLGRISEGVSVRQIAREEGIQERTLRYWVSEAKGGFADSARAKEAGIDSLAEQCIEIADSTDEDANSRRVRIDTRLRLLGKWSKRYGDKIQVDATHRKADELPDDELAAIASGTGIVAPPRNPGVAD